MPILFDKNLEPINLRGISITEHAVEQMAIRLETVDRVEVIREITAAAMPSCFIAMNFWGFTPRDGDRFAVKTPHGIGILIVNHLKDIDVAGYLVTWISDEEATAQKFQEIEWALLPRRTKTEDRTLTIDIPAGARMYFPHELTKDWEHEVLREYR